MAKKKKAPKRWTKAEVNLLKKLFPTNPTLKLLKSSNERQILSKRKLQEWDFVSQRGI